MRHVTRSGFGHLLLGLLGVVILGLGAVNSWRSESSTGLLVAGGVILFFAVIGTNWDTVRVRHGESEAELSRFRHAVERVSHSDNEETLRARLDALQIELREAATTRETAHSVWREILRRSEHTAAYRPQQGVAGHNYLSDGVELFYDHPDLDTFVATFIMDTPIGSVLTGAASNRDEIVEPPRRFSVTILPHDLVGSDPAGGGLKPGVYRVRWRAERLFQESDGASVDAFDEFVIPPPDESLGPHPG